MTGKWKEPISIFVFGVEAFYQEGSSELRRRLHEARQSMSMNMIMVHVSR